jgi:hypothetical protein
MSDVCVPATIHYIRALIRASQAGGVLEVLCVSACDIQKCK